MLQKTHVAVYGTGHTRKSVLWYIVLVIKCKIIFIAYLFGSFFFPSSLTKVIEQTVSISQLLLEIFMHWSRRLDNTKTLPRTSPQMLPKQPSNKLVIPSIEENSPQNVNSFLRQVVAFKAHTGSYNRPPF
jgi:hypothetical protein